MLLPYSHNITRIGESTNYSRSANFGSTTIPLGKRTTKYIRSIGPPIVSENRKATVVLALSEIPGFQYRPARGRKPSSSPSQFLSPSLRLWSLERFVRRSRKHIRILGHPQHDYRYRNSSTTGAETTTNRRLVRTNFTWSHAVQQSELFTHKILPSSSLPSMKSPKRKRISYVKAGVLIVDQVKPAILKETAVRFDLSKGKGIK